MNSKRWRIFWAWTLAAILMLALWIGFAACSSDQPEARGGSGPDIAGEQLAAAQSISTTIATAGGVIRTLGYDTLVLWVDYDKGTETSTAVRIKWARTAAAATTYAHRTWSTTAGFRTLAAVDAYSMTASGNSYVTYDVTGVPFAQVYVQAQGIVTESNQGTITVTYSAVAE